LDPLPPPGASCWVPGATESPSWHEHDQRRNDVRLDVASPENVAVAPKPGPRIGSHLALGSISLAEHWPSSAHGVAVSELSFARLSNLPLREYRPGCRLQVPQHSVPRARFPAIDAHNHLGRWLAEDGQWTAPDVGALLSLMDECNVGAIVNLDGRWGEELEANLDRYDRGYPGHFATFCQLDWRETRERGFEDRLAASIRDSWDAGAKGLKIWKDLGLQVRDDVGQLLMPDDERLGAVWQTVAELGMPVWIHTADPLAFFDPVDEQNERLDELLKHPEWSLADRDRFPRFERLTEALENLVGANPETMFVGAHVGCYAENLRWVTRMLDAYPNFHVDIAARIAELGRQPGAARALFLRHPDRILFGTDLFPPDASDYAIHFRFLETKDEYFPYSTEELPPQGRWAIYGLGLSDGVLRSVYAYNARRLLPTIHPEA
jgi:predicted TIM-barrel fold metal-dependent hydrolase